MAKSRRKSSKSKSASQAGRTPVGGHTYGGRKFGCYGKRVRAGKSSKKVARIFCAKTE